MIRLEGEEAKKVGAFIDLENILHLAGKQGIDIYPEDFKSLLKNILQDNQQLVIANCYHSVPKSEWHRKFLFSLENLGIVNIISIPKKQEEMKVLDKEEDSYSFTVERSNVDIKIISDLDDVILARIPTSIDILWLMSGDKDFKEVFEKAKKRGIKTRVACFPEGLSKSLKELVGKENCHNFKLLLD